MNTVTLSILFLPAFALGQSGAEAQPTVEKRPSKVWTRVGPLGETPKHVTDAYPLSDQQNKGDWSKCEPMSDEFEGKELDRSKWTVGMSWWKGRQLALFTDKNVTVSDGKLHLTMLKEPVPPEFGSLGYHDFTSAALHTENSELSNEFKSNDIDALIDELVQYKKIHFPDDQRRILTCGEVNGFIMDIRRCTREIQEIAFKKGLIPCIPADQTDQSADE